MIKSTFLIILLTWIFISTGCMKMGMKKSEHMMGSMMFGFSKSVKTVNKGKAIDQMIEELVIDLSKQKLDINSIAVWRIKSQTAGLDVEMIRKKLITQLVLNRFKIVTRERLNKLLEEQSFSLSGAIDENSAAAIGKLIGVEGFIDGYASIENNRLILNFTLIKTTSGVVIWAKTLERNIQL